MPILKREATGEYGGIVKRPFSGAGRDWRPNDEIPAELALTWRLANRMTLARSMYVHWYALPEGGDRLPETISVVLADDTVVVATLERDPDTGGLVARLPVPEETPARAGNGKGRN